MLVTRGCNGSDGGLPGWGGEVWQPGRKKQSLCLWVLIDGENESRDGGGLISLIKLHNRLQLRSTRLYEIIREVAETPASHMLHLFGFMGTNHLIRFRIHVY